MNKIRRRACRDILLRMREARDALREVLEDEMDAYTRKTMGLPVSKREASERDAICGLQDTLENLEAACTVLKEYEDQ